jgi:hypothetical protein
MRNEIPRSRSMTRTPSRDDRHGWSAIFTSAPCATIGLTSLLHDRSHAKQVDYEIGPRCRSDHDGREYFLRQAVQETKGFVDDEESGIRPGSSRAPTVGEDRPLGGRMTPNAGPRACLRGSAPNRRPHPCASAPWRRPARGSRASPGASRSRSPVVRSADTGGA